MTAPFGPLTPDFVLSAVEASGLVCDGRLLTLNSYENRVYQVGIEDAQPLIAKFYRPGRWSDEAILEEHAFLAELADAEIPAVPALEVGGSTLHHYEGFRVALFPRRGGRAPELDDPAVLGWLGRFLGRIHAIGANKPFAHRPDLTIRSFGEEPRDELLASPFLPSELRETWRSVVDQALDGVRRCFERAGEQPMIRLHGDVHGGNVLWTDAGPHFVDFDDARNGPAVQDLWMLLSGDAPAMARQLDHVLEGYEQFADFDPASLHLVEALRTLRLIHYAGWIARRWDDPAFPAAFSWFDTPRYWQDMILSLREQVALMDESPLARQF
ncbi:serine/threonine protein kinase [Zoogloea sp. 1C4]|uniref:serine/threonine protein kinase n=1 Tax=Zoogloea sp. 1C4 TaxID=2570190 RepID=UPI001290AB1B|nr:serine/threonine protein kinase [Zoogloea sp. 1C4]